MNDRTDLEFLNHNTFCRLTINKYLEVKAFAFNKTLHSVSNKPSVPCQEASWPVLDFWYYSLQTKQMKH